jgi:hypothetical protein
MYGATRTKVYARRMTNPAAAPSITPHPAESRAPVEVGSNRWYMADAVVRSARSTTGCCSELTPGSAAVGAEPDHAVRHGRSCPSGPHADRRSAEWLGACAVDEVVVAQR